MRLDEIEQSGNLEPLKLKTDNPATKFGEQGQKWLDNKREHAESFGYTAHGIMKHHGNQTGIFNREAFIPLDVLSKIKGQNDEQNRVRKEDLEWLMSHMKETGKLPPSEAYFHGEYPPLILVDQRGIPTISEGNHRVMAAQQLGFDVLPVTIRYFNGGELEEGPLSPEKVMQYDSQALAQGYGFGNYKQ